VFLLRLRCDPRMKSCRCWSFSLACLAEPRPQVSLEFCAIETSGLEKASRLYRLIAPVVELYHLRLHLKFVPNHLSSNFVHPPPQQFSIDIVFSIDGVAGWFSVCRQVVFSLRGFWILRGAYRKSRSSSAGSHSSRHRTFLLSARPFTSQYCKDWLHRLAALLYYSSWI